MQSRRLTDLRLARLMLWLRLWCELVRRLLKQETLEANLAPVLCARMKEMRAWALRLILVRASRRVGRLGSPRIKTGHSAFHIPAGARRIVLGSKLRRAVRGRDIHAQLDALIDLLTNSEPVIAALAKRLRRGMRRRLSRSLVSSLVALCVAATRPRAQLNTS